MKQKSILVFLLAFLALGAAGQTKISGMVVDSVSRDPQPYVTVRIFPSNNDEVPLSTFLTDEKGAFSHEVSKAGNYNLVVSAIGKKTRKVDFVAGATGELRLGEIGLIEQKSSEGTAVVSAQRPVVKMETDKITYDMGADPDSKSTTMLEMLRRVPLVNVDGQDNITVNGQSNFKIYVNGKPNPMLSQNASAVLKAMPASFAKNVEVITNPGARYDAEGTGGIINITTANFGGPGGQGESMEGYSADITGAVTTRGQMGSGFFSMQKGKFSMSVNGSLHNGRSGLGAMDFDRVQYAETGDITTTMRNAQRTHNRFYRSGLSLSYQIDSLRLLTAAANLMGFGNNQKSVGSMGMAASGMPLMSYNQTGSTRMHFRSIDANLDYQRTFANCPERMLTLSYQFSASPNRNKSFTDFSDAVTMMADIDLTDRFSDNNMHSTEHTGQADFTTPVAEGHQLSVGLKFIGRKNSSDSKYYDVIDNVLVPNAMNSVDYRFFNDIAAAYTEYEGKMGLFKLKAGARYEHTWQRVRYADRPEQNFSLDYGNFVPSATFSFNPTPLQSIGLSYAMRISRPGIDQLNPYRDMSDPTSIRYGNSDLDAEKTHQISLVASSFTPKFIINLNFHYNFCSNGIENYSFYDESHVLNTTFGNVNKNHDFGVNAFMNYKPTAKTSIMMNAGGSYVDLRSGALDVHNSGWQGNLMVGLQQTMWWNLKLSLNAMAMTKRHVLQGTMGGFGGVMGSLTKKFFGETLSVGISGFMPFDGKNIRFKMNTSDKTFSNRMSMRMPVAQIGITATLHLGKMNISTKRVNRSISNDDVKASDQQGGGMNSGGTGISTGGMMNGGM